MMALGLAGSALLLTLAVAMVYLLQRRLAETHRLQAARDRDREAITSMQELELLVRTRLLGALTGPLEDEEAFGVAAAILAEHLEAKEVLLAYFDGNQALNAQSVGTGPKGGLDHQAQLALEAATTGQRPPWLAEGMAMLALRIEYEAQVAGYLVVGREAKAFTPMERELYTRIFSLFAAPIFTRGLRARKERVRLEAERSLRWNEARLKNFFEESGDMIYSCNAEDVIASINPSGLELLGKKDIFEVVGRPFGLFALSSEDRQFFLRKIKDEGKVDDYEIVLRKADGSVVFCIETARAVRDKDGRLIEIQGIVKNISERIERERQLWKTNMELAEANSELNRTQMIMVQHEKLASIGQLAAGVAHEINNPLGFLKSNQETLSSYLETMAQAWEEAEALDKAAHDEIAQRLDLPYILGETKALLRESDEGFRRIMDIVMNLRTFSRQEGSTAVGAYDLNKGIESSLVMARNEIKYVADVVLDLGELPAITAAGGEINQVLLNILVNSAQAIEGQKRKEKGTIKVSTRVEGGYAVVRIEDDGPGIPEDQRLKVFDPFFTTKAPGKGTGLGLSISYDIVARKHNGAIRIETSSLGGAAFRIDLPIQGPEGGKDA